MEPKPHPENQAALAQTQAESGEYVQMVHDLHDRDYVSDQHASCRHQVRLGHGNAPATHDRAEHHDYECALNRGCGYVNAPNENEQHPNCHHASAQFLLRRVGGGSQEE